jgi:fatty acid desaturase
MNKYIFSDEINLQLLPLQKSNNYRWILGLSYDYFCIMFAIILSVRVSWFLYPISIIIIGSRMRALATLLHDAAHLRLCKNRKLNNFVGTYLTGLPILQGFKSYVDSHVKNHHLFLGNKNKDPDYQYYISKGLYNQTSKNKFIKKFILYPFLGLNTFSFIKYLIKNRLFSQKHISESVMIFSFIIFNAAIFIYFSLFKYFILFWFIPLLFIFPIIGWFIEISEHYPLLGSASIDLYKSRNRESHFIEKLFFGVHNESYHLAHHLKPGIPYWNIISAHNIMLNDNNYKQVNLNNSGIFLSKNFTTSFIKHLYSSINPIIEGKLY